MIGQIQPQTSLTPTEKTAVPTEQVAKLAPLEGEKNLLSLLGSKPASRLTVRANALSGCLF